MLSRVLLLVVSGLLFASIFFPMWRIELEAPQYPEGLVLQLHADKIGGDVDVINGLNHYIGMKTLHKENFFEFTILPYIFVFFGLFAFLMVFIAKRKGVVLLFSSFVVFGVLAAIDFYRWNYDYGHDLDPNAAIKVPGMAYQPPLLGYKQLLNFGAYSIPDIGGWMLIGVIVLLAFIVVKETNLIQKFRKPNIHPALLILLTFFIISCSNKQAVPIKINVDNCDYCAMSIADGRYAAEVITEKGRAYKFDDIKCMVNYCKESANIKMSAYYVNDFTQNNVLIPAQAAFFLSGETIQTPMRGGIVAFMSKSTAQEHEARLNAKLISWEAVLSK